MGRHMIKVAGIDHTSKVLDLGCGKGLACKQIAELTGAACTGMDLAEANVERGNAIAKENPHLKLDFVVGSFTELPKELLEREYTHVFSQVAFCHVHKLLTIEMLRGHKTWRHIAEDAGLEIMYYENISKHIEQSYRDLAAEAAKYDFKSADGMPIVENYRK